ncbi:hypothetical protein M422DRAFT_247871 [Sphaerobolus stellatus SS14]|nr:hypothetical protein M422DRAFT_247871 [Sphaerobolus stellatus SS14]
MEKELVALKLEVEHLRLASYKQEKVIQKQADKLSTLKESIYCDEESDSDSDVSDSDSEGGQTSNGEHPESILDENDEDKDALDFDRSISTNNTELRSSRMLAPRGMTPIRTTYEDDMQPATFLGSQEEYTALLERSATRLMIDTFHLSIKNTTGIIAWADQELFDTWTTDAMGYGDCWKIMLGCRIKLSPDDLDGSGQLGNFLEEALLTSRYELDMGY